MRKLQHPVPDPILTLIGDITVSFALLESTLQFLTGMLLSGEQRIGQIVTAELSFQKLRALCVSLYKERRGDDAPGLEKLRDLMRRAGKIEETRNQITHSVWGAGNTPETVTRFKTTAKEKKGLEFRFEHIDEDRLASLAEGIKVLASDIQGFMFEEASKPS